MRADAIASHGRVGQVGAMSIGSLGRLANIGEIIVTAVWREIVRLTSGFVQIINRESGM